MKFCVLASGSKANCTYIESGTTRILIDAGLSGKELQRRLSRFAVTAESLSAILITHEHSDHIHGAAILSRRCRLPIFANAGTYRAAGDGLGKVTCRQEFETGTTFTVGALTIHPFAVSHDAADPVGFRVTDGAVSLGYCTDTGRISRLIRHRLAECHGLILESNHDLQLLKNGNYPPYLKQRIQSSTGHLANHEAAAFLREIRHARLQHVVLAHLSEANNRPELVHNTITTFLEADRPREPDSPRLTVAGRTAMREAVRLR